MLFACAVQTCLWNRPVQIVLDTTVVMTLLVDPTMGLIIRVELENTHLFSMVLPCTPKCPLSTIPMPRYSPSRCPQLKIGNWGVTLGHNILHPKNCKQYWFVISGCRFTVTCESQVSRKFSRIFFIVLKEVDPSGPFPQNRFSENSLLKSHKNWVGAEYCL